ncbi:hypothetical protein HanPI659440_Chr12g0459811 [Helianthus annuus]|nr:hypothetical protein HanPI659440_Chr12g0459811 [Helianthus annuus]
MYGYVRVMRELVRVYIWLGTSVDVYVYIYIYMYEGASECMYVSEDIGRYVCMWMSMCICIKVCMSVCEYVKM